MFDWSKMPPVSLPFEMPGLFALPGMKEEAQGEDGGESSFPFPLSLLMSMPQALLPFQTSGAQSEGEDEIFGGLPLSFLFPFYQMALMYRFFQSFIPQQEEKGDSGEQDGFSPFGFPIPPAVLQKLLQLDASPKTLEQMQRVMDFLFDATGFDT